MIELEEGYYQNYFETMLREVRQTYSDILSEEETSFIHIYESLSDTSRKMYLRLFMRAGPWFFLEKLDYKEIPDRDMAINELSAASLVNTVADHDDPELWSLFKVSELRDFLSLNSADLATDLMEIKKLQKTQLLELVMALSVIKRQLYLRELGTKFVKILATEHANLIPLLFFGNHQQGMTDFILEGIGQRKFEQIAIDRKTRLFSDRTILEKRRFLRTWKDILWACKESQINPSDESAWEELEKTSLSVLDQTKSWPPTEAYLYAHSFLNVAQYFEKNKKLDLAYLFYQETELPPSRERRARYLHSRKHTAEATALALQMYHSPHTLDEKDKAEKILKKWKISIASDAKGTTRYSSRKISIDLGEKNVEEHTLDYFKSQGWDGAHLENSVWNHLFALTFWTAMFHPVPGAFANRFQGGPRDLWEADFYRSRKEIIDELIEIVFASNKILVSYISAMYIEKNGLFNFLTGWNNEVHIWTLKLAESLPIDSLKKVMLRILEHPGDLLKGFPDLILKNESSGELMLAEIKGPGDRLRAEQEQWLRFFTASGLPCELVWVEKKEF